VSGKAGRRGKPTPIGATLREYLGGAGLGGLTVAASIASKWPEMVGPGIAGHSRPQEIKGGRLTLIVDSSAWMNQLSLLSGDIVSKINAALGEDVVTDIRLRAGKISPSTSGALAKPKRGSERPPRRKLTADEQADIERTASEIDDPELRARAKRLLEKAAATRKKA